MRARAHAQTAAAPATRLDGALTSVRVSKAAKAATGANPNHARAQAAGYEPIVLLLHEYHVIAPPAAQLLDEILHSLSVRVRLLGRR